MAPQLGKHIRQNWDGSHKNSRSSLFSKLFTHTHTHTPYGKTLLDAYSPNSAELKRYQTSSNGTKRLSQRYQTSTARILVFREGTKRLFAKVPNGRVPNAKGTKCPKTLSTCSQNGLSLCEPNIPRREQGNICLEHSTLKQIQHHPRMNSRPFRKIECPREVQSPSYY